MTRTDKLGFVLFVLVWWLAMTLTLAWKGGDLVWR